MGSVWAGLVGLDGAEQLGARVLEAEVFDDGERVFTKVLGGTGLEVLRDVFARVVEVRVADERHVETAEAIAVLDKLAEVGVRENETGGEDIVGKHGAEGVRNVRVRLDHLLAGGLEEELGTAGTASLEVDDSLDTGIGLIVLSDVQMASILKRLFAVVEEEHHRVVQLAACVGKRERTKGFHKDSNTYTVVGSTGTGQGAVEVRVEQQAVGLALIGTVRDAQPPGWTWRSSVSRRRWT